MIAHKNKIVGQLRGGVKQLLTANGVKQFTGTASFKDRNTIAIDGDALIGAKKDDHRHRLDLGHARLSAPSTSASWKAGHSFASTGCRQSMIVLGGGFIGCEMACMAAKLGVKVVIVELLEDILTPARLRRRAAKCAGTWKRLSASAC